MTRKLFFLATLALLALAPGLAPALAQEGGSVAIQAPLGAAFTYQGQLKQGGNPVTANCDFQFSLWDAATGGAQIGSTQTTTNVSVTNGLFTVQLDFGAGAFNGEARWLEIGVRCPAGSGSYTALSPRQPLTPAPYALALPGLYTQQNATSPNLIGGFSGNSVTGGVVGATIGGGGVSGATNRVMDNFGTIGGGGNNWAGNGGASTTDAIYATVGGGRTNTAEANYATIGGGNNNIASGNNATIGGGNNNNASGNSATIGGGGSNNASGNTATIGGGGGNTADGFVATISGGSGNNASGQYATVGGGYSNNASGGSATVAGGSNNNAAGDYSFVAGRRAIANASGMFVWADSANEDFSGSVADSFIVRASGGVYFGKASSSTGAPSGRALDTWTGAYLTNGGTWTNSSDRAAKENFADVNSREVLARVAALPIQTWNYTSEADAIRHIGPTAQDFYAAFGVGEDDKHITTIDADGVALAAIQGLYGVVQEKDAEIANLQSQNSNLKSQISNLEARLAALERGAGVAHSTGLDLNAWAMGIVLLGALGGGAWLVRQRKGNQ